jgi:hypothetical protein
LATLRLGVVGQRFFSCGRHLMLPLCHNCCMRPAFLLISQVGKSSLTLLPQCSCLGKVDFEVAAAKPKEDGCCGRHPL